MGFLQFLASMASILNTASALIPMVAAARSTADPTVSNAGLENISKVIEIAKPLVAAGEAVSSAAVASGKPALSGTDKLAIAQTAVSQAHAMVTAAGGTTQTFDEYWVPINAAITAICAANKPVLPTDNQLGQQTA